MKKMKKQFLLIAFVFAALEGFGQAKKDSVKAMHQDFTETQLMQLISAAQIAKGSDYIWNSPNITTRDAKYFEIFCDSISAVWSNQLQKWHPAPPPKIDSTSAPKK